MSNRDFKGVWIPKEIWLNPNLSMIEKCLLVEIDSLDNEDHCFASNDYFAEFLNCSERTITAAISRLIELELIEVIEFDGRKRRIQSLFGVKSASQNLRGTNAKVAEQSGKNCEYNNTSNNTSKSSLSDLDKFGEFWQEYPIKVGKNKAKTLYHKLCKSNPTLHTLIISAIRLQKQEKDILKSRGEFYANWKHPSVWLNHGCWEDEVTITQQPTPQQAAKPVGVGWLYEEKYQVKSPTK